VRNVWVGAGVLLLASVAGAQSSFIEHYKAAMDARSGRDYARMESELREALKQRPAHPTALYKLAAAQALRGQTAAFETLDQLADMDLVFDPWSDPDFAALKGNDDFTSVRRAFARNKEPTGSLERMFRLRSATFIPEGIAYDSERDHFFIGSVHERRIQRIKRDDSEVDFIKPNPDLWAVFGMATDERRELLWVATAAVPEMEDAKPEELGRTAIIGYDIDSGKQKHRFVLEDGAGPHQLGDLIVLDDGTIYTTDSDGGMLYELDPKAGKFKALTRPGQLSSPQGLVATRHEHELYVADYTQGLYRYEIKSGKLERLTTAEDVCVYGIDGLYRLDEDLIAIQNGIRPHRVVRLRIGSYGKRVRGLTVLAANHKSFDEPTLGVMVKRSLFFIANSQWGRFDKDHKLPPPEQLRRPLVMRLTFDDDGPRPGAGGPAPTAAPPGGPLPGGVPVPCLPGQTC
jgi:hypothetical protein